jgi:pimeloyl-ACP methyl ester carboxylesterase
MPEVIACPDPTCRAPAGIVDGWTWGSTSGPVEHIKTGCGRGHWFTLTVDSLDLRPAPTAAQPSSVPCPSVREEKQAVHRQPIVRDGGHHATGDDARQRVLAGTPVTERRLRLAGVATAVLEGGNGPDMVLLHGQGGWAAGWLPVLPDLVHTHHVVVPDLPGLGASETPQGSFDAATVLAWLGELIEQTCVAPPVVVGASLGGSIAAPFAAAHSQRLDELVLVDTGCLVGRVRSAPGVLLALIRHSLRPSRRTMVRFLGQVTVDLERLPSARGALGAVPGLLAGSRPHAFGAAGQPPPAAGARVAADPAAGAGADHRPDRADLGAAGPGDAAADRTAGQRPLRLAAARDRRRRPLPGGRPAQSVPRGAARCARRPLTTDQPQARPAR